MYFVKTTLSAMLVLALLALPAPCNAAPLVWNQINSDGFGDANNRASYAMQAYGDDLYAGTYNGTTGTEVWRYDGTAWLQVNADGFGDPANTHTYCMAVYGDGLYAGTWNMNNAAEVWAYDGTDWSPVNSDGFGNPNNLGVFSMVVYGGNLYAITMNQAQGCEVWAYNGTSWSVSATAGFGDVNNSYGYNLAVFNGRLYAGTMNYSTGAEVWEYNGSSWNQVNTDGFGDANNLSHSMSEYGGNLYVGTYNGTNGSEIWRYDGGAWLQVNADGFGDAANVTSRSMVVYDNRLYLGTQNNTDAGGVWGYDGTTWEQANTAGFGDTNNKRCYANAVYEQRLYTATYNTISGIEVWRNSTFEVDATVSGGHGTVDPPAQQVAPGGDATINIFPDPGYHIASITDNGTPQAISNPYVIDSVSEDHSVVITFASTMRLEKTASPPGDIVRGQIITYTLRAGNDGDHAISGCTLFDLVPAYTDYADHSTTLNGILIADAGGTTPLAAGLTVNSPGQPPGIIAAGGEAFVTFRVQVGNDLPLGASVRNTSTLRADGQPELEASAVNGSAADLPETWYFAEGSTQEGFDEYILLSNMEDSGITATITYITDGGVERQFNHEIPAHSRRTVFVNAEMPGEVGLAAIVQGTGGLICERALYFNHNGIDGGHQAIGANAPDVDLFFAEGFTGSRGSPFDEWILVLNPNTSAADLHVTYMFPDGGTEERDYRVEGRRRLSINVDGEVGENREVSTRISSDQPVVAERAMYFIYQGVWSGGHIGRAATGARNDWYLAEGYTGWEGSPFDEWILVANDNDSSNPVQVTFMFPDGSTQSFDFVAAPMSRMTVYADACVGEGQMISAHLHSDLPVVVERAMYFDYRLQWNGGHNSVGANSPMSAFYFAEGYTGNPSSRFETWLLLQNTSAETKTAVVDYMLVSGEVIEQEVELAPHSRTTVYTNDRLGQEALEFSMRVRSKDGSACLLAERAMYFDYQGSFGHAIGGDDVLGY